MKKISTLFFCIALLFTKAAFAQPEFGWAKSFGGNGTDFGHAIATDAAGNVYTTGYYNTSLDSVDFDPGPGSYKLKAVGNSDVYISKLDVNGNFVWAKSISGSAVEEAEGIAVDGSGNILITGWFRGTVDFDPGAGVANVSSANSGAYDIFVAKYTTDGNYLWAKSTRGSGAGSNYGYGITVDALGNSYTTGYFTDVVDFDPGPGAATLTANSNDIFVMKLDAGGNYVWARQIGGASSDVGYAITSDAAGNTYTTGYFGGTADFDPGSGTANLTTKGGLDVFIFKLDALGNYTWAKNFGGNSSDYGNDIKTAGGYVYITGYCLGSIDFDPSAGTYNGTSYGNYDIYVSKLDVAGNFVWARTMGGAGGDAASGLSIDNESNVYVTGYFSLTADFDPSGAGTVNFTSAGNLDIFVCKLNSSGSYVWGVSYGTISREEGMAITNDATGNMYATGAFSGTTDFDPGPGINNLVSNGYSDVYVLKFSVNQALPVTLSGFTAQYINDNYIELKWQSSTELSTAKYIIERSADGREFTAIGSVVAAGNSSTANNYVFYDHQPLSSVNYYRLKMVDIDGNFQYSKIVALNLKIKVEFKLYPNPVRSNLFVQAIGSNENATIQIRDLWGRLLHQSQIHLNGTTSTGINVQSLPAGKYHLIMHTISGKLTKEFIIMP